MSTTKAQLTQKLVNAYPLWADARSDEQSLTFQYLNIIAGKPLDHLYKQLNRIESNYFLGSSVLSDPDVFYQIRLPGSYEFTKADDDDTELIYIAPTVSGYIDNTAYEVIVASGNNIEGFWLDPAPSRFSIEDTATGDTLLFSGYIIRSPFEPLTTGGATHLTNQLTITVSGGENFWGFDEGQFRRGVIQVKGENRVGVDVTEEIPFLHDDTKQTLNEYVSVSGLRVYGIEEPDTTFIWVKSANFNNDWHKVAYDNLDYSPENEQIPMFWGLNGTETNNYPVLQLAKYDFDAFDLLAAGYSGRHPIMEIELLDQHSQPISPLDLAVEPFSERLWVVSSGMLYCYDAGRPYPDMSQTVDKDYGAECRIEPNMYYVARGEEVQLDYIWRRPVKGLVKHRVWVQYPDGNKYSIIDGSITVYTTGADSWDWGEPFNRQLRASDTFTLSQRGEYIFSLEAVYTDETTSIDQRIITVPYKVPLKQYDLPEIGIVYAITGIDIDSEGKIWVLDNQGTKHQLDPAWDIMLIDYANKYIYFHENYDTVKVL